MPNSSAPSTLPLPNNIELITEYDAIVIRRTWRSPVAYFLVFFSLLWNAFMIVWMTVTIKQEAWMMVAFGSIHATIGLFLIYFTIASFLNKTDIRIDSYNLSVKHFPLPWTGQVKIPVENIKQVYCKEKITRSNNSTNVSYELHSIDRDNRQKKLLSGLTNSDQARFIETEIEKTLGIKNQPVNGELH